LTALTTQTFDGSAWTAHSIRTFVYDGWLLALELVDNADSTHQTFEYFWGNDLSGTEQGAGGVGGLVAVSVDGTYHLPCYDHNGNVTAYVSENGTLSAQYLYGAFGNTLEQSGPLAETFRHRFSTKYFIPETQSYYYGYRHYAPNFGCWLSRDPIGEDGGNNLYAICENNLVNRFDLLGNTWKTNWEFFWDWVFEQGEENRVYGTGDVELEEMQSSPGAQQMRSAYKNGRCKTIKNGVFGTARAYFTTTWLPNKTAFQIGGFLYDAVNNEDGTVTYTIRNQASAYSFFLHLSFIPHKPRGGTVRLFGNINQTFEFTEVSPCCEKKKADK
jgi:RHS repeat-associated protein